MSNSIQIDHDCRYHLYLFTERESYDPDIHKCSICGRKWIIKINGLGNQIYKEVIEK